jgi:hypothetical protein
MSVQVERSYAVNPSGTDSGLLAAAGHRKYLQIPTTKKALQKIAQEQIRPGTTYIRRSCRKLTYCWHALHVHIAVQKYAICGSQPRALLR